MTQFTVGVDISEPSDIQHAIDVLGAIKAAVTALRAGGGPPTSPVTASPVSTGTGEGSGFGIPGPTGADPASSTDGAGPTATTAASPSDAPTPPKRTRASKKPPEDIVIFDAKGERLAGYTHSADAASRFLTEWKKVLDPVELDAMKQANIPSLQRLVVDDMNAIANEVAAHANRVKNPPKTPEVPASGTEAELEAMFSAPPAPAAAGTAPAFTVSAPAEPKMDKEEFRRRIMSQVAQPLGSQEASRWLRDDMKLLEIGGIPEDRFADILAAGIAHVKKLAAAAAA
jgi:hypothetical protein